MLHRRNMLPHSGSLFTRSACHPIAETSVWQIDALRLTLENKYVLDRAVRPNA